MNFLKQIKYWYKFSPKVWGSLLIGWISVLIGLTPYLRMDRAGALLICAVIISEIFYDKRHRLFLHQILPGASTNHVYREVEIHDGEKAHQGIEIIQLRNVSLKSTVNADNWHLYQLATEKEFHSAEESREWDLERTVKRLESSVDWIIVISAISGTILWAFANQV